MDNSVFTQTKTEKTTLAADRGRANQEMSTNDYIKPSFWTSIWTSQLRPKRGKKVKTAKNSTE